MNLRKSEGMPLNIPGILVPFQLLWNPRLVLPSIIVKGIENFNAFFAKDIRQIDFWALKKAGYRGAVFDKDNCLTIPHRDTLVPELQEAWKECKDVFGEGNVLIVSNSAGTGLDAGGLQAESVSHHLGVPVLFHKSYKPAYSCIDSIRSYFTSRHPSIGDNQLVIAGDRIFTDIVLANRIHGLHQKSLRKPLASSPSLKGPPVSEEKTMSPEDAMLAQGSPTHTLAIWTTGVWKRESTAMRWMESRLVKAVDRWSTPPPRGSLDPEQFIKPVIEPPPRKRTRFGLDILSYFKHSTT